MGRVNASVFSSALTFAMIGVVQLWTTPSCATQFADDVRATPPPKPTAADARIVEERQVAEAILQAQVVTATPLLDVKPNPDVSDKELAAVDGGLVDLRASREGAIHPRREDQALSVDQPGGGPAHHGLAGNDPEDGGISGWVARPRPGHAEIPGQFPDDLAHRRDLLDPRRRRPSDGH